jgi:tetratricopeptide (TPR) repeat protein
MQTRWGQFLKKSAPAIVLLAVAILLFYRSWDGPFIFDDLHKIVQNPDLRKIENLLDRLFYPYRANQIPQRNDPSRPLVFLIYTLLHHFFELDPAPYRILNTLFHFGNSVLGFFLLQGLQRRLFGSVDPIAAFLGALFYLVLPINAGTAAYIYGLSDLLSTFFILGALLCVYGLQDGSQKPRLILLFLFFLLALASKQLAVILPFFLILLDWSFAGNARLARLKTRGTLYAAFFLLSGGYFIFRYFTLGGWGDLEAYDNTHSVLQYLSVQGRVIWEYLRLTVIPFGLSIDHDVSPASYSGIQTGIAWAGLLGLLGLGAVLLRSSRNIQRALGLAIFFYWIAVIPTSSFFPTVDCMVERRVYLANFGFAIAWLGLAQAAGEWQKDGIRNRNFVWGLFLVLIFGYGARSFSRNEIFRSHRAVWEEVVRHYPTSARGLNNLGNVTIEEGRQQEAKGIFEKLLQLYPTKISALVNLAMLEGDRQLPGYDPAKSLQLYRRAIELAPGDVIARYNMAWIYFQEKRFEEAEALYQSVLQLNPSYALAYSQLGYIRLYRGEWAQARMYFEKALSIEPGLEDAQKGLRAAGQ